jgi:hypothetical protein
MDTQEIKKCRQEAERDILEILKALEAATAMDVRGVNIDRFESLSSSGVGVVQINLELGRF